MNSTLVKGIPYINQYNNSNTISVAYFTVDKERASDLWRQRTDQCLRLTNGSRIQYDVEALQQAIPEGSIIIVRMSDERIARTKTACGKNSAFNAVDQRAMYCSCTLPAWH